MEVQLNSIDKKVLTLGLYSLARILTKMHPDAIKDIEATAEKLGVINQFKTISEIDGKMREILDSAEDLLKGLRESQPGMEGIDDIIHRAMKDQKDPDKN